MIQKIKSQRLLFFDRNASNFALDKGNNPVRRTIINFLDTMQKSISNHLNPSGDLSIPTLCRKELYGKDRYRHQNR